MRALSLHQPWASLIAHGVKTIETRDWSTTYRGPIAIHAAKKWTQEQHDRWLEFADDFGPSRFPTLPEWKPPRRRVAADLPPLGCVVALATVTSCGQFTASGQSAVRPHGTIPLAWLNGELVAADDMLTGDCTPGRWGWKLDLVLRLDEPFPMKGMQGLWTPHADERAALAVAKGWWISGPPPEDEPDDPFTIHTEIPRSFMP